MDAIDSYAPLFLDVGICKYATQLFITFCGHLIFFTYSHNFENTWLLCIEWRLSVYQCYTQGGYLDSLQYKSHD